jgi:hypothetical protein
MRNYAQCNVVISCLHSRRFARNAEPHISENGFMMSVLHRTIFVAARQQNQRSHRVSLYGNSAASPE